MRYNGFLVYPLLYRGPFPTDLLILTRCPFSVSLSLCAYIDTQTRAVPLKSSPGTTKDRWSCYLACKTDLECIFFFWEQKTKSCKTYDYVADTLIPAPGGFYYAYEVSE